MGGERRLDRPLSRACPGGRAAGAGSHRQFRRQGASLGFGWKRGEANQAIGRSRGSRTTKIHALTDALGNPLSFFLTGGEAHDLVGADHLLPGMQADALIADKAFDADERVIEPLATAGKAAVIPPKANRQVGRDYDRELFKERHLIENFFARLNCVMPGPRSVEIPHVPSLPGPGIAIVVGSNHT